jgi:hypothetical protein
MNISSAKFSDLLREVEQLKTQLTSLFAIVGAKTAPRDSSIAGFCERNGISRSTYINLRRTGRGPRETAAGARRIIITEQDEAAWLRERQAVAAALTEQRADSGEVAQAFRNDVARRYEMMPPVVPR